MTDVSEGGAQEERPVILVAVEPRLYASAIGLAIGRVRPLLDLRIVEPDDLVAEVLRLGPRLVLCSRPRWRPGRDGDPAWVEYCPYAEVPPRVRIWADGRCSTIEDADLEGLLSIVDGRGPQGSPGPRDGKGDPGCSGIRNREKQLVREQGAQER